MICVQPVVAIKFCPQLFTLRESTQSQSSSQPETPTSNGFQLPYRMVFAVATLDSVIIHDTQVSVMTIVAHDRLDCSSQLADLAVALPPCIFQQ